MLKSIKNAQKLLKIKKKCIFFAKNLVVSKKSSNFAAENKKQLTTNKTNSVMNKTYFTKMFGKIQLNTTVINRNFRIKVAGIVNGVKVNKLVGVSGLLNILDGSWEKLVKMVLRAFNSAADKCRCKIYGGAAVTFYVK